MNDTIVESDGKLRKEYLPAIYFDSSVVIDYYIAYGIFVPPLADYTNDDYYGEGGLLSVVREILKSEKRIKGVIEIRKKLHYDSKKAKATPVVSPLALLELMGWHAEVAFKQIAAEASGVKFIEKKHPKQIGDYLKEIMERSDEIMEKKIAEAKNGKTRDDVKPTSIELLAMETYLSQHFADDHALLGLLQVDIVNFQLTLNKVWEEPFFYAYLQLDVADIIHILLAQHLGCKYIASFDSDFKRVKDIIEEKTGTEVLVSPDEILNCLSKG